MAMGIKETNEVGGLHLWTANLKMLAGTFALSVGS